MQRDGTFGSELLWLFTVLIHAYQRARPAAEISSNYERPRVSVKNYELRGKSQLAVNAKYFLSCSMSESSVEGPNQER